MRSTRSPKYSARRNYGGGRNMVAMPFLNVNGQDYWIPNIPKLPKPSVNRLIVDRATIDKMRRYRKR